MALDTNVLVYSHRRESAHHDEALRLLRRFAQGHEAWAIPWPCMYEFFSVVTNPRIWKTRPTAPGEAWRQMAAWMDAPSLRLLGETAGFAETLSQFVTRPRVRGPIVHDARVAALCVAHGVDTLLTRDRDFHLFPELITRDPFPPG